VKLLDEGTPAWCPVEAIHLGSDQYRIVEPNADPTDIRWEFQTGATVRCKPKLASDGKGTLLLAYK
jgi:hypothetical protein